MCIHWCLRMWPNPWLKMDYIGNGQIIWQGHNVKLDGRSVAHRETQFNLGWDASGEIPARDAAHKSKNQVPERYYSNAVPEAHISGACWNSQMENGPTVTNAATAQRGTVSIRRNCAEKVMGSQKNTGTKSSEHARVWSMMQMRRLTDEDDWWAPSMEQENSLKIRTEVCSNSQLFSFFFYIV